MFKKIIAFLVSMFLTLSFTLRRASTGENNPNNEMTIQQNRFAAENTFISQKRERNKLPTYEKEKENLPVPVWEGHQDAIDCYYKAWELAFRHLRRPALTSGFVLHVGFRFHSHVRAVRLPVVQFSGDAR